MQMNSPPDELYNKNSESHRARNNNREDTVRYNNNKIYYNIDTYLMDMKIIPYRSTDKDPRSKNAWFPL